MTMVVTRLARTILVTRLARTIPLQGRDGFGFARCPLASGKAQEVGLLEA